ncbi:MAG: hypothetical protein JSW39_09355 [Desulfobacterales bacterium]|nr:MAG: hypothetical protein JSW39_09355 [Desulfobacterales bacterium]
MGKIVKKEVCKCENCGNEAEMVITCSLPEAEQEDQKNAAKPPPAPQDAAAPQRVRGSAKCTHCGNEADMWIDF